MVEKDGRDLGLRKEEEQDRCLLGDAYLWIEFEIPRK